MLVRLPPRAAGVLEERVGEEYVLVAPTSSTAYALSGVPARVWAATADDAAAEAVGLGDDPEVTTAIAELIEKGLLQAPAGMSRRTALRLGGAVAGGGIIALALPAVDAAASNGTIAPAALTFNCVNSTSQTNPGAQATKQTLTVGPSTTPRVVTFSLISAGGGGGGASTLISYTGASSGQSTNPGNGGNGGFITGTITLPASTVADVISVYVGCGSTGKEITTAASGGTPASTINTSYPGYGDGYGGKGYGGGVYTKNGTTGAVTSAQSGAAGSGGGASALVFANDTGGPSLVAGAGGGGGAGGTTGQTTAPTGGSGGGTGSGTAGAGSLATGGGAALTTTGTGGTDGAAGSTTGSTVVNIAPGVGTGPNLSPGGSGGGAAVTGNNATYQSSTLVAIGGGGGAGYRGGGGGGSVTTTTAATTGGGGGGSGYAAATASSTNGTATITVATSGTVSGAAGGSGYGVGGAAVPASSSTPYGPSGPSQPGQISVSSPGGFTIAAG